MNPKKVNGIICIILAALCFACMNLFVKLSGNLPVMQKVFFRNLVAAIAAFIILKRSKIPFKVGKGNRLYIFLRASFGFIGIITNFYAITKLNIADASMLNKLSPFFAIIFSIFILKEHPSVKDMIAVVIAFAGALFVIKPTFGFEAMPAVIGMFSGMCAGFAYTCVRKLGTNGVKGPVIVFFFSIFSTLCSVPFLLTGYVPMSGFQWFSLIMAGVSAAGGQFAITAAYSYAPAKEISVFDYTQVIFAAILSMIVLGDMPDHLSIIGYLIIIGIAIWKWNNNRTKKLR